MGEQRRAHGQGARHRRQKRDASVRTVIVHGKIAA
jgi:hypothetical protein